MQRGMGPSILFSSGIGESARKTARVELHKSIRHGVHLSNTQSTLQDFKSKFRRLKTTEEPSEISVGITALRFSMIHFALQHRISWTSSAWLLPDGTFELLCMLLGVLLGNTARQDLPMGQTIFNFNDIEMNQQTFDEFVAEFAMSSPSEPRLKALLMTFIAGRIVDITKSSPINLNGNVKLEPDKIDIKLVPFNVSQDISFGLLSSNGIVDINKKRPVDRGTFPEDEKENGVTGEEKTVTDLIRIFLEPGNLILNFTGSLSETRLKIANSERVPTQRHLAYLRGLRYA